MSKPVLWVTKKCAPTQYNETQRSETFGYCSQVATYFL